MSKLPKGIDNITKPVYDLVKKEIPGIVNQAIQADKDIISKIEMEYVEDNNITNIIFPKGVMPLSITINDRGLYLLGLMLVDSAGTKVYELDDYLVEDDGRLSLAIIRDISEQNINGLAYISINGINEYLLTDTYHLYFPATSGGTKLYKHTITGSIRDEDLGYGISNIKIEVIDSSAIAFSNIRAKIGGILFVGFDTDPNKDAVCWFTANSESWIAFSIDGMSEYSAFSPNYVENLTDTVTEL